MPWWMKYPYLDESGDGGEGGGGPGDGDAGGEGGEGGPSEPRWPETWREDLAGENEQELNQLKRYGTPQDLWRKTRALETKLSSGEYRMKMPDEPSEADIAEYRQVNGIPEKWEDYDTEISEGFVVGEEDKPIVDGFLQVAHEVNAEPAQVKQMLSWYYDEVERQTEERAEQDQKAQEDAEEDLREEYGKNYRAERNRITNFLNATMPKDLVDEVLHGRGASLTPLGSHPAFLKWANHIARQLDATGTLTGAEAGDAGKTIDDRMKEIKNIMRTDRARYDRENLAAELRDLVDKKAAIDARAA